MPHWKIPTILQNFDIFIALSRYDPESFGVATLEASVTGLPVVFSNVGGLPETVKDKITGIVIDNENPLAASNAMSKLANDSELRPHLGRNGRSRVKAQYNWRDSISKMLKIYERLI